MERKPILLSKNSCALIWIYTRCDKLFDVAAHAYDKYDDRKIWKEAAKEFIRQLENYWSELFLEALRNEIDELLIHIRAQGKRII